MTNECSNDQMTNDRSIARQFGHWGLVIGALFLNTAVSSAFGQETWNLTTADFRTERVGLRSLDDRAVTVKTGQSEPHQVPLDRLLMLERIGDRPAASQVQFIATLVGEDRAAGKPGSLSGENLVWENPTLGQITLPVKSIVSIVRVVPGQDPQQVIASLSQPSSLPTTQQTEDIVALVNGDSVKGIVSSIGATAISVQQGGGETIDVPLDSITRVIFAATGAAPVAATHGFRISLADGSAITASRVKLSNADQNLSFYLSDGSPRRVAMPQVLGIEQVNGPVVWLSSQRPSESVQTPFFELSWPARMDRAVDGEPIRVGERTFSRGIGVHSYSRVSFPIDPAMRAFRTQYAIAGDWPYANVTVRIKLDDQIAFEKTDVRSGALAPPVLIDLDGHARTLTLEVDYGQNYDVQDRFNWIEPALLKIKPEPPPTPPAAPPTSAPTTSPATAPSASAQ
jgi:hypothetical protein